MDICDSLSHSRQDGGDAREKVEKKALCIEDVAPVAELYNLQPSSRLIFTSYSRKY